MEAVEPASGPSSVDAEGLVCPPEEESLLNLNQRRHFTFSHPQQGRIDFNTVNPSLPTGMDFLIHPCRWIDDEENVRTPPKLGRYWEIHPLRPRDFPRPSRFPSGFALGKSLGSREISRASGMDFPIPPSFWWSTDTIQFLISKKTIV